MSTRIGHPAPPLAGTVYLPGARGPQALPVDELAGWWIVLVFYPGDFSVGSPHELRTYASLEDDFTAEDARIVAASTDSFWTHKAWFESNPLLATVRYPVLADTTQQVAAAYGALAADGTAARVTFLLDRDRIIRGASVSARPRDSLTTLRTLRPRKERL